jgi:hypothetical protein
LIPFHSKPIVAFRGQQRLRELQAQADDKEDLDSHVRLIVSGRLLEPDSAVMDSFKDQFKRYCVVHAVIVPADQIQKQGHQAMLQAGGAVDGGIFQRRAPRAGVNQAGWAVHAPPTNIDDDEDETETESGKDMEEVGQPRTTTKPRTTTGGNGGRRDKTEDDESKWRTTRQKGGRREETEDDETKRRTMRQSRGQRDKTQDNDEQRGDERKPKRGRATVMTSNDDKKRVP